MFKQNEEHNTKQTCSISFVIIRHIDKNNSTKAKKQKEGEGEDPSFQDGKEANTSKKNKDKKTKKKWPQWDLNPRSLAY